MTSTDQGEAVIIEAAINGGTPKSRNATVPRSPAEVAEDGLRCLEAGAAIVHNHNDEAVVGGEPEHDPAPYIEAWSVILAERPDALLYPTMPGGGPHTTFQRRYSHIPALAEAKIAPVHAGNLRARSRKPVPDLPSRTERIEPAPDESQVTTGFGSDERLHEESAAEPAEEPAGERLADGADDGRGFGAAAKDRAAARGR